MRRFWLYTETLLWCTSRALLMTLFGKGTLAMRRFWLYLETETEKCPDFLPFSGAPHTQHAKKQPLRSLGLFDFSIGVQSHCRNKYLISLGHVTYIVTLTLFDVKYNVLAHGSRTQLKWRRIALQSIREIFDDQCRSTGMDIQLIFNYQLCRKSREWFQNLEIRTLTSLQRLATRRRSYLRFSNLLNLQHRGHGSAPLAETVTSAGSDEMFKL